jgi:hypothetical protein
MYYDARTCGYEIIITPAKSQYECSRAVYFIVTLSMLLSQPKMLKLCGLFF